VPVITRWTSHFCSVTRLLQVNKALKLTATRHRDEFIEYVGANDAKKVLKAKRVLDRVVNEDWWKELAMYGSVSFMNLLADIDINRVKLHLEPLAISVNVTQQSNTRCDQVLVLLGQLQRVYTGMVHKDRSSPGAEDEDVDHPCTTILNSIEKRWSKVDQDLFIACLFLNPSLKASQSTENDCCGADWHSSLPLYSCILCSTMP
jgi:hypothetical protein